LPDRFLSRELEKAQGARTELQDSGVQKSTKEAQLEAAGLTTRTANRYEQLAAPEEQLAPAVETAMENYLWAAGSSSKSALTLGGLVKRLHAPFNRLWRVFHTSDSGAGG
jgi:hypothetical protein